MIKFDPTNRPSFVRHELLTGETHPLGETFGNFITLLDGREDRVDSGDYIAQDDLGNPVDLIRAANASAQEERITLELGRDLKRTIRQTLKNLNLTDIQKADLVNRILAVYVLIDDGDLRAAKFMAENTATGGAFTAGRQAALVALIDTAIQSLPA
jgi:hypothetical protein